jgi:Cof subfamily protein (haloacid dehalogenase superfamily)
MDASKIKMVVFDIDGTLIAEGQHMIQDSAVKGIHALHDSGTKVLVATGRAPYFIKPHVFEVLDSDYYVTINGQCVMDRNHTIISRHNLNKADILRLLEIAQSENIALGCKCSNQIVVLHDYDNFVKYYGHGEAHSGRFLNAVGNPDALDSDMAMGLFLVGDVSKLLPYMAQFPQWTHSRAFSWGLDIFDKDVHKSRGIEDVMAILGLTWDEVMVFGDADNDLRMIEKAGIGVAMGNATENLKKIADYVTSDLEEDGIYNALKHFKLI